MISDLSKPCTIDESEKRDNSTESTQGDSVEDLSTKQPLGMCGREVRSSLYNDYVYYVWYSLYTQFLLIM